MKSLLVLLTVLSFASTGAAQAAATAAAPDESKAIAQQLPSYPLTTCPISGEPLDSMGKPMDMVHEGRLVRFCCKSCVKEFKKDPAPALKKIDEGVVQAQKASYPLTKCVVSGEELGSAGEPVDYVQGTRLVRLCCKDCIKGVQKDPAKALATVDAALIEAQKKTYPLTTCLVCSKKIEGAGVDHLYGVRLVRFCSDACAPAFDKEPAKFVAQLDAAPKKN
jgi:YHS domain-containing protein